ncbi:unnamed protein product [Timema podura]|uniref:Uncharacterized protein n=1 Tax=Timema podura TaxID=61482 RepID=A0ABN7NSC6_TIMPD|nr:unnamed protein product [Timema podura]
MATCGCFFRELKGENIRQIVQDRNTPLSEKSGRFIKNSENKTNLITVLAQELILHAKSLHGIEDILGGILNGDDLFSGVEDVSILSSQQEADTSLILPSSHVLQKGYTTLVIQSDDTDVMLFLIWHDLAKNIWMQQIKIHRYINIYEIAVKLGDAISGDSEKFGDGKRTFQFKEILKLSIKR